MRRAVAAVASTIVVTTACARPVVPAAAVKTPAAPPSAQLVLDSCPQAGSSSELPAISLACLAPAQSTARLDSSRLGGHPTLVNLWASWCVPCQREMPALQQAHEAAGAQMLLVGVLTKDDKGSGLDFLAAIAATYPEVEDPAGRLLAALHGVGLPVTVMLDRNGTVVWRKLGRLSGGDLQEALAAGGVRVTLPDLP